MCNKKALWDTLKPYDALILSGHMHMGDNELISAAPSPDSIQSGTLEKHNITSLGGAWWCGQTCIDGSPTGFKVYDIDSTAVSWRFRGCVLPSTDQFKVYVDNPAYPGQIVVNVYDYDPRWKVELFEEGVKLCDLNASKAKTPISMRIPPRFAEAGSVRCRRRTSCAPRFQIPFAALKSALRTALEGSWATPFHSNSASSRTVQSPRDSSP